MSRDLENIEINEVLIELEEREKALFEISNEICNCLKKYETNICEACVEEKPLQAYLTESYLSFDEIDSNIEDIINGKCKEIQDNSKLFVLRDRYPKYTFKNKGSEFSKRYFSNLEFLKKQANANIQKAKPKLNLNKFEDLVYFVLENQKYFEDFHEFKNMLNAKSYVKEMKELSKLPGYTIKDVFGIGNYSIRKKHFQRNINKRNLKEDSLYFIKHTTPIYENLGHNLRKELN